MDLQELVQGIKSLTETQLPDNEEMTKTQLIFPVLSQLGWEVRDVLTNRVRLEHNVGNNTKADIALLAPDEKVLVIIEAKSRQFQLTDKHVEQVLNYSFHEGVGICVLTNGINWWFYSPFEENREFRKFKELDIQEDLVGHITDTLEKYLSYKNLNSKKAKDFAKSAIEGLKLRIEFERAWKELVEEVPSGFINTFKSSLDEEVKKSMSSAALNKLIKSFLSERLTSQHGTEKTEQDNLNNQFNDQSIGHDNSPSKNSGKPVEIVVFGQSHAVGSWKDIWITVAEEVYKQRASQFDEYVGKPHGKRSYIEASRSNVKKYHKIRNTKFHLELNASAEALLARTEYLLELAGFSSDVLSIKFG